MAQIGEYPRLPGPANREDFLAAQARNRRASRWFTGWSALAVTLMGLPLSAVISPLLYAFAIVLLDLVNLVVPTTPDLLARIGESEAVASNGPLPVGTIAVIVAALVLPGSVALLLAWLGVRRLFRRAGSDAMVLALGAREPRADDLEERQLANVVAEMAAAAGVPPPDVRIIDSVVPNAAAVGSRLDDSTVVVTTALLAELDRQETQAVIGHVVASVGNGDLRIGATILSVFQTLGLVSTVLRAPGEKGPRRVLWRLLRYAFKRPGADDTATAATLLAREGAEPEADSTTLDQGGLKSFLSLPFVMTSASFGATVSLWGFFLVDPFLRRSWVARRHLADAGAVQLTRDADAVARGVAKLRGPVPGVEWAAHLFAAGDEDPAAGGGTIAMRRYQPKRADRIDRLNAMGASVEPPLRPPAGKRWVVAVFLLVTSPCWVPLAALFLVVPLLLAMVALMIDMLFLAPVVALLHALLR
jgi:Zn-dependent protease with chaperone function